MNRKVDPKPSVDVASVKSKRQDSLRDDRSSEDNLKNKSNSKPIGDSRVPRDPVDKYKLADRNSGLTFLVWSQHKDDSHPPRFLADLLGENPTKKEIEDLLACTEDSADTILATVKWGLEVSNFWFKTQKGIIRTYTDLVNAYPEMAKQYRNYHKKGANA